MLIIKYAILFLIFSIATMMGFLISKKYRERVYELKEFKEFLGILESKIKFTYQPLGEIFEETSAIMNNKISNILENTKVKLKKYEFKQAWETSIENQKNNFSFKEEDLNIIKSLGNMLRKN